MHEAFYIVGPTAVGKTAVAVELAARYGAEIVSADAYQIYRGFNLLTAKPSLKQREHVRHHLLGHLALSQSYNVARFLGEATEVIERIKTRGLPVIVVGGNGMYIKALTHGLSPLPEVQPQLRAELEAAPPAELLTRLRDLDPVAFRTIEHRNLRRVIRALEVCLTTGKPFSSYQTGWSEEDPASPTRGVFLTRERTDLIVRINERVDEMFAQGVVNEVQRDRQQPLSATARQILGLSEVEAHLVGQMSLAECAERIKIATRQYAKRQMTWFKREPCFKSVLCPSGVITGPALEQVDHCFREWREYQAVRPPTEATMLNSQLDNN